MRSVAIGAIVVFAGCGGSATNVGEGTGGGRTGKGGSAALDDGGTSGDRGSTGGSESTGGRGSTGGSESTGGRESSGGEGPAAGGQTGGAGGSPPARDAGLGICSGAALYNHNIDTAAYLLFDASEGMNTASPAPSKTWWDAMHSAAIGYATDLRFHGMWNAVQFYPNRDGDAGACDGRYDVPAVPILPLPGPAEAPTPFDGRTPRGDNAPGQALASALGYMKGQIFNYPFMRGAVVLVTGSAPADCANTDLSTLAFVANTSHPPIKTYVVALGDPADVESLNALALAGGTEKALVLPGNDLRKEFSDAMTKVRYADHSCSYDLPESYLDPSTVQVYVTQQGADSVPLSFVDSLEACDPGGVVYHPKTEEAWPPKITLCPRTCVEFAGASVSATLTCAAAEAAARSR